MTFHIFQRIERSDPMKLKFLDIKAFKKFFTGHKF